MRHLCECHINDFYPRLSDTLHCLLFVRIEGNRCAVWRVGFLPHAAPLIGISQQNLCALPCPAVGAPS